MPVPMPIPMDEHLHRSMPASPYDMDSRDPRLMNTPFEARMGLEASDYFSPMGLGPLGPRHRGSSLLASSFPPGLEPDTMMGTQQQYIDETVRRCGSAFAPVRLY